MQICPQCEEPYDGDRCWTCVSRSEDINQTFVLTFPVALVAATIGYSTAFYLFPPLVWDLKTFAVPVVCSVAFIVLGCVLWSRLTRYANLIRMATVLVAASWLVPPAYFFFNGILDGHSSTAVRSSVISKQITLGRDGGPDLIISISWNHQDVVQTFRVDPDIYSAVKPGDVVKVLLHPGAFAKPWYGDGLFSNGRNQVELISQ